MSRTILLSVSLVVFLGLSACDKKTDPSISYDDNRNPNIKAAIESTTQGLYEQAVEDYEKALAAYPKLPRAHYELALLYSDHLANYASAIHHLLKYRALTPNAPNSNEVDALIEKNKVDLALTIPNSPVQNADIMAKISAENAELKKNLTNAMQSIAQKDAQLASGGTIAAAPVAVAAPTSLDQVPHQAPSRPQSTTPTASPLATAPASLDTPVAPVAQAAGEVKIYTIRPGDSLWKIAAEFYPGEVTDGIKKIKEANPDVAKNERNLKPGRTLNIPL